MPFHGSYLPVILASSKNPRFMSLINRFYSYVIVERLIKPMYMKVIPPRIVLYTQDVSNITGLTPRAARKLLCSIRKHLGKKTGTFVTVQEFSKYTGIDCEDIQPFIV
jgi:hypothetical protein